MSGALKGLWIVISAVISELVFIFIVLPSLPDFLIIPRYDLGRGLGTFALGSFLFTVAGVFVGLILRKHYGSPSDLEKSSPQNLIKTLVVAIFLAVVLLGLAVGVFVMLDKTGMYNF